MSAMIFSFTDLDIDLVMSNSSTRPTASRHTKI